MRTAMGWLACTLGRAMTRASKGRLGAKFLVISATPTASGVDQAGSVIGESSHTMPLKNRPKGPSKMRNLSDVLCVNLA
jgi:hypothetical protein